MIRSMTGFAAMPATLTLDDGTKITLEISLKSLNAKFFETYCKLPHSLSALETDFVRVLKKKLYRGYVTLVIHISNAQTTYKGGVSPALATVRDYVAAINKIQEEFKLSGSLTINDIIQLPNVFSAEEKNFDESTKKMILDLLDSLADVLIAAQQKEGKELKNDLEKRRNVIAQEIATIQQESLTLLETQKAKIGEVLATLEQDTSKFAELQKNTAYALLDKMDTHEEVVRFKSHLANFTAQLDSQDIEKGKRLDFTVQELSREINTITAKCSDASIGSLAINVKVELEKMREQIQNIV